MTEESREDNASHAGRVGNKRKNRSLKVLPSGSKGEWPANLGELMEWHTNEVEEVLRAAQLRLRDSARIIDDYRQGKIDFSEAQGTRVESRHEMGGKISRWHRWNHARQKR